MLLYERKYNDARCAICASHYASFYIKETSKGIGVLLSKYEQHHR
ncbi:hypothetical protein GCM10007935_44440 [Hydrogenophaga electricum]|uniref:Uncharacterized protein n=1 Tax=Hydrogenophaga electricum TaxID=1230953 RepID=A0ABQ6CE89_9BURK|nr:hypothetical protein GCM10007935_44440 [Hydrogenophaga electricum]